MAPSVELPFKDFRLEFEKKLNLKALWNMKQKEQIPILTYCILLILDTILFNF